jgi:hypothetical protein
MEWDFMVWVFLQMLQHLPSASSKPILYILEHCQSLSHSHIGVSRTATRWQERQAAELQPHSCKMAADTVRAVDSLSTFDYNLSEMQTYKCLCCEELRLELLKAKMEILSYEEVLKLLQEELSNKEFRNQSDPSKLNDSCDEQSKVQTLRDDWMQGATKINRKYKDTNSNLIQFLPCTANKFDLLSNLKVNESTSAPIMEMENLNISGYQQTTRRTELAESGKKGKHKVLIVGDSHAKKCATNLQHNLGKNYKVTGFIKPGTQMREIINTAKEEISTLMSKDVVVIWGGANDISRNNTKFALKDLSNFMNSNNEVNIVLVSSPQRYDLTSSSCVNKEVIKFNRQLSKLSKFHSYVKLLEINLHRNHFTRHGQHLKLVGKKLVSSELAKFIGKLFHEICLDSIYMQWKDSTLKGDNPKIQDKTGITSVKALNMNTEDDLPDLETVS